MDYADIKVDDIQSISISFIETLQKFVVLTDEQKLLLENDVCNQLTDILEKFFNCPDYRNHM